jgi:hypothetical protein
MGEDKNEQWYTNKDLYEMVQGLKTDLQETRMLIKQYNGLRQRLDSCDDAIADLISQAKGRASVGTAIQSWGGWVVAILSLLLALLKTAGLV